MTDFLVAYHPADHEWADWIARQLEQAGYAVVLHAWEFRAGVDPLLEVQGAVRQARQSLALLSPEGARALEGQPQRVVHLLQRLASDPGALRLVRVRACDPGLLLGSLPVLDLVGKEENDARTALIQGVRAAPAPQGGLPAFPGASGPAARQEGGFPGTARVSPSVEFSIEHGDITGIDADVIALKYAQGFHGADELVARALGEGGVDTDPIHPSVGEYRLLQAQGSIRARQVLFLGVPRLRDFGYAQIGAFPARALEILADAAPDAGHVAMTIHGPNYGLDEVEALLAQFQGCYEAVQHRRCPERLARITIVEKNRNRVNRLRTALDEALSGTGHADRAAGAWAFRMSVRRQVETVFEFSGSTGMGTRAGVESNAKPHVFVAMPFRKDMEDLFYFGIQQAVHECGFLCERIDQEAYTGDILDQIKRRIETARVVVAELSDSTPNVYLEVGYAWGKGRPTILLVKDPARLHFDVCGQRCLVYESIRDLQARLTTELKKLQAKGRL
jgi:hypothetical protein